jgi:hypothetical protein
LRNLTAFVAEQRRKLKESEDVLVALRQEQAKLRPVVEANRHTVEALFAIQDERARAELCGGKEVLDSVSVSWPPSSHRLVTKS